MTLYSIKRQNWLAYVRFRCRRKPDSDNFPRPSWLTKTHDRVGSGIQDATPKQFLEAILLKILLLFQVSAVLFKCFVLFFEPLGLAVRPSVQILGKTEYNKLDESLELSRLSVSFFIQTPFGTDFCWNQK